MQCTSLYSVYSAFTAYIVCTYWVSFVWLFILCMLRLCVLILAREKYTTNKQECATYCTEKVKLLYHDQCVTFIITPSSLWATTSNISLVEIFDGSVFFFSFKLMLLQSPSIMVIGLLAVFFSHHVSSSQCCTWEAFCKNCDVKRYDENDNYV